MTMFLSGRVATTVDLSGDKITLAGEKDVVRTVGDGNRDVLRVIDPIVDTLVDSADAAWRSAGEKTHGRVTVTYTTRTYPYGDTTAVQYTFYVGNVRAGYVNVSEI